MAIRLKDNQVRFIDFLTKQLNEKNRNVLAVLRRGLSSPPGEDISLYPYVARFVPDFERGTSREKIYYLTASLFAYHQLSCEKGNFGNHMRAAVDQSNEASTERRFTVLLNSHADDMPDYLRQSVSYLKSRDVPIHWYALFEDLLAWNHPDKYVQRRWANSFWGYQENENDSNNKKE